MTPYAQLAPEQRLDPTFDISQVALPQGYDSFAFSEGGGGWNATQNPNSQFWQQFPGGEGGPGWNPWTSEFGGSGIPWSDWRTGGEFVGTALGGAATGNYGLLGGDAAAIGRDTSTPISTGGSMPNQLPAPPPMNYPGGTPGFNEGGGGTDLGWLGPLLGGGAGLYGLTQGNRTSNPALTPQQQALINAGQQTYNTALDPRQELYGRTQQQLQDQVRAADSARGVAMSPYSAGVENKAMGDFNIDWQNAQLGRQVAGTGAMAGANQAATGIGQLGLQNREFGARQNASSMAAFLTALQGLTGGSGRGAGGTGMPGQNYLGNWWNSMFGGGSQPGMYGSGVDQFGNPVSSNFSGGVPGNPMGPPGGGFNDFTGGYGGGAGGATGGGGFSDFTGGYGGGPSPEMPIDWSSFAG